MIKITRKTPGLPGPHRLTGTWSASLGSPRGQTPLGDKYSQLRPDKGRPGQLITHSVHQVVHTGQVGSHADLKLVHRLISTHGVEA